MNISSSFCTFHAFNISCNTRFRKLEKRVAFLLLCSLVPDRLDDEPILLKGTPNLPVGFCSFFSSEVRSFKHRIRPHPCHLLANLAALLCQCLASVHSFQPNPKTLFQKWESPCLSVRHQHCTFSTKSIILSADLELSLGFPIIRRMFALIPTCRVNFIVCFYLLQAHALSYEG